MIVIFSDFLKNIYIPFLLVRLDESFYQAIKEPVKTEMHRILLKFDDPFKDYNSEKKRLSLYRKLGFYTDPKECSMKAVPITKVRGTQVSITDKKFSVFRIPLADSLKKLLKVDGLF